MGRACNYRAHMCPTLLHIYFQRKNVGNICRSYMTHVRPLYGSYLKNIWRISGKYVAYIRNMYVGIYVPFITCEHIWHVLHMEYIGNIYKLYREHECNAFHGWGHQMHGSFWRNFENKMAATVVLHP